MPPRCCSNLETGLGLRPAPRLTVGAPTITIVWMGYLLETAYIVVTVIIALGTFFSYFRALDKQLAKSPPKPRTAWDFFFIVFTGFFGFLCASGVALAIYVVTTSGIQNPSIEGYVAIVFFVLLLGSLSFFTLRASAKKLKHTR